MTSGAVPAAPPLDPELVQALADAGVQHVAVGLTATDVAAERQALDARAVSIEQLAGDPRFVVDTREICGPDGGPPVELLVAVPAVEAAEPRPVLYHCHGGGLVAGNSRVGLPAVLDLAAAVDAAVVSVEYRLAPEHPLPAAHDDAWAGLCWAAAHCDELGGSADAIVLHGASAGGALAAGLAQRARDTEQVAVRGQLLVYPMLDDANDSLSARQMEGIGVWDRVTNRMAWDCALGDRRGVPPPYAVPARAEDLAGLAPAYLEVGSAETFRDETVAYAQRIWACGGVAELHVWPGACHGFDLLAPGSYVTRRARAARMDWLARLLGR